MKIGRRIDGFQRTRGVLKLMAKVIYRLWKDDNKDLMILPGSLPLYDGSTRNELTYYLRTGWDAVIEGDIDGERAETTELETKEPRFGAVASRAPCRPHHFPWHRSVRPWRTKPRHTRPGTRPRPAGLLPAGAGFVDLFRRAEPARRPAALPEHHPATRRRTRRASGSTPAPISAAKWRTGRRRFDDANDVRGRIAEALRETHRRRVIL